MAIDMVDIRQKFQEKQYKLTPQRRIILEAFVDHQDEHLSAEDVHTIVRQHSSEIGLATVYRTLELFSELDVLQKMDFGDGRSRYEINEKTTPHHHHHLICLACNKVKEFEDDLLETLETVISRKSNFTIVDHQVKFYGYCEECQKKREISE
ncbi:MULTISPECIES: Fur family transcriptional regulator [Pelosinus]|uniref:Ferric-uptake regulator n=1 Tax=Pelosinus fermentans B4 TaxID=1149862 RepID=I9AZU6_9FIRM|nr:MULTISPECIES: Fur family transcriptional regulator [Pelosinus]EIW18402.1 ferric-uptake regulator [Pelosinus fermentans B4]EIW24415.1 ferric uptake regulator, Fur family [Pelosinus fermentans A11]OAM94526.1 ferric uptake regulator, Fur family [Pelosinus fermentans DSM 17108]SDR11367.1 Fur family transcriptional regulator, ferric uptake regulator [Pelosinus fermentans]